MVRPRTGDFLYSEEELDVMLEDIGLFKSLGIAGVVFGVLSRDGTVDVSHTLMYVFDDLFTMLRLHKLWQARRGGTSHARWVETFVKWSSAQRISAKFVFTGRLT